MLSVGVHLVTAPALLCPVVVRPSRSLRHDTPLPVGGPLGPAAHPPPSTLTSSPEVVHPERHLLPAGTLHRGVGSVQGCVAAHAKPS